MLLVPCWPFTGLFFNSTRSPNFRYANSISVCHTFVHVCHGHGKGTIGPMLRRNVDIVGIKRTPRVEDKKKKKEEDDDDDGGNVDDVTIDVRQ